MEERESGARGLWFSAGLEADGLLSGLLFLSHWCLYQVVTSEVCAFEGRWPSNAKPNFDGLQKDQRDLILLFFIYNITGQEQMWHDQESGRFLEYCDGTFMAKRAFIQF